MFLTEIITTEKCQKIQEDEKNDVENVLCSDEFSFATSLTQGGCDETDSDRIRSEFVCKTHHNQVERGK